MNRRYNPGILRSFVIMEDLHANCPENWPQEILRDRCEELASRDSARSLRWPWQRAAPIQLKPGMAQQTPVYAVAQRVAALPSIILPRTKQHSFKMGRAGALRSNQLPMARTMASAPVSTQTNVSLATPSPAEAVQARCEILSSPLPLSMVQGTPSHGS